MPPEVAVVVTLIVYKIVLVGLGIWSQRRINDDADFFLGGRQLGPWVAAISASASSSSAWTLLGVSGAAYGWGLGAIWLFPACVGGFMFNWLWLAPALYRRSRMTGALTVTDLVAGGHRTVARLASLIILVSLCTYVAAQFQGAGKAFHETFGWSVDNSILLGSAIVVFYTLLGGFWAVSLTDTVQGLLMAATAVVLPTAAVMAAVSEVGVEGLLANVPDGYASLTRNLAPAAALGFIAGTLGIGLGYPGQPHVVNRLMALRSADAIRPARIIALTWAIVVYSGMLVLGWAGRVLLPDLGDNEVIFVAATHRLFPPVVAGIMLAAVLSAIMSTADSQLLVAASAVTHDLDGTHAAPLRRSRLTIVVLSLCAVVAALYGPSAIFDRVLFAWSAMGAAFGPLLLVTVQRGVVAPGRAFMSMASGFALSVVAYSVADTRGTAVERIVPFVVAGIIAASGACRRSDRRA